MTFTRVNCLAQNWVSKHICEFFQGCLKLSAVPNWAKFFFFFFLGGGGGATWPSETWGGPGEKP